MLILCEGARTEPNYFSALCQDWELKSVKVTKATLLKDMAATVRRELRSGYDEIWCVVDHDERNQEIANLQNALARLSSTSRPVRSCVSTPCFEYWLLLHFKFTAQPFVGIQGGDSACMQVIRKLQGHIEGYAKNEPAVFNRCRENLRQALENCKRLDQTQQAPATDVWRLVDRLRRLREGDKGG